MPHFVFFGLCVWMTFRKPSYGDVKVIAVVLANELDEINSVAEAIFWRNPLRLAFWRIAT